MKVAVTGTSGFVGTALVPLLMSQGHSVLTIRHGEPLPALDGADAVIHLGGLAHRTGRSTPTPEEFESANHTFTRDLAQRAQDAGIRRFVLVSTINVVAANKGVLTPDMPVNPLSPYGESKARAERAVLDLPEIGPVVLRPPLVYGKGPRANIRSLTRLALSPWPLPFASVNNRRSMVGLSNLIEAVTFAATAPGIEGRIFHVTDARPLSLREIVGTIRKSLGRPEHLFPAPVWLMRAIMQATGRSHMAEQLFGDLLVDGTALNIAGWNPRHPPEENLAAMAASLNRVEDRPS
ncbi:MAG: NAD-dependent epimerase/dehydratase family protein [Rhizobiaceae bacterium]|nr:NAD-dependent epimerase/dehydratase family protein [Rhizobiaceae bacterium]